MDAEDDVTKLSRTGRGAEIIGGESGKVGVGWWFGVGGIWHIFLCNTFSETTLIGLNCVQCFCVFPLRFGETNMFSEFRMAEDTTLRILSYRSALRDKPRD